MPKDPRIKKVLVIGSGPIIIGQAAEFDYSGTQACRALKAEGIETVLLNSNPATIMTDPDVADHVYIEPMTLEVVERILDIEKPDSVLPNLGGQMGLNLSMELARSGYLDRTGIRLLACKPETIDRAEDRELFKETMEKLHQPIIPSEVVETLEDALACADRIGYPVIVRPAFTMGGTGGGICENKAKLIEIGTNGLRLSPIHQILVEKCIAGWKEIEYEVMRDHKGNVITVCNMENLDPVGIHTGDSVVVAPSQTLTDHEYQMLRTAALDIITELGIEGGCNCQFALKPDSFDYAVIEVNPRVSRSSALASKATGYPIAKVATKIAIGYTLDEITNDVTGKTCACFEPALDYIVVKYPKWPFDKFVYADKSLGTQMMATGEVMSIGNSFEAAMMKAVSSIELGMDTLTHKPFEELSDDEIVDHMHVQDAERVFCVYEALKRGIDHETIYKITKIDGTELDVYTPLNYPDPAEIETAMEPFAKVSVLTPPEYVGAIMELCQERRGTYKDTKYLDTDRVELHYELPLNEIVYDFFDALKSRTKGYASFDYEMSGYLVSKLVKLDIMISGDVVDALSFIVHADRAYSRGRKMAEKLKENIPRQMFEVPIQAAIGGKIIARETVKAFRKDVLAKCYGGDISRKRKLLEKQKEGKKRMRTFGTVSVPSEAFMAVLKLDEE